MDQAIQDHHPLGVQEAARHQIKYLARVNDTVVVDLSFSASDPHLEVRDTHIGWSAEEWKLLRFQVVNNIRFLILPGVWIRYLTSRLLRQVLRRPTATGKSCSAMPLGVRSQERFQVFRFSGGHYAAGLEFGLRDRIETPFR